MKAFVLIQLLLLPFAAVASDEAELDVESGNWEAVSYKSGLTTEICVAATKNNRIIFRSDDEGIQIRSSDKSWSLGPETLGVVAFDIGSYHRRIEMGANDSRTLATNVTPELASAILDAAAKATDLKITCGDKTTEVVSLRGSTKALNEWRTCTAINRFGDIGQPVGPLTTPF